MPTPARHGRRNGRPGGLLAGLLLILLPAVAPAGWGLGFLARSHQAITEGLQDSTRWLDRFFGDERIEEDARSELRLGLTTSFLEGEGVQFGTRLRGRVNLPRISRRFQLLFEGEPDENDPTGLRSETGSSALRLLVRSAPARQLSFAAGFRGGLKDPHLFIRTRLTRLYQDGLWVHRLTPAVTWIADDDWEAYLRHDLERTFAGRYFFRTTTKPKWRDKENGLRLEQNFTWIRRLSLLRYVAFDWLNDFYSERDEKLEVSHLRVRYRRAVWYDKLFLEIAPGLRFHADQGFHPELEGYVQLEVVFAP